MERQDHSHRAEPKRQQDAHEVKLERHVSQALRQQRCMDALQAKCKAYEKEHRAKGKTIYVEHEKLKAASGEGEGLRETEVKEGPGGSCKAHLEVGSCCRS